MNTPTLYAELRFPSQMVCVVDGCEATPHIKGTRFGHKVPPDSTSGPGLIIDAFCEEGHCWTITFSDHSAGTWIHCNRLPDNDVTM